MKKHIFALILMTLAIPTFSFASSSTITESKIQIENLRRRIHALHEPYLKILSPRNQKNLTEGKTYNITWKIKNWPDEDIKTGLHLYLLACNDSACNEKSYHFLAGFIDPRKMHYSWKVQSIDADGKFIHQTSCYKIYAINSRSIALDVPEIKDESDLCFGIQWEHEKSITVISPNGGEELVEGKNYTIRWSARGLPHDARIGIYLFRADGAEMDIARSLPPFSGAYTWNVTTSGGWAVGARPPTAKLATLLGIRTAHANSGTYTIAVSAELGGFIGVSDKSDAPFNIMSPSPMVDIKVNGSDTPKPVPFTAPFTVSWTSTGVDYCSGYGFFVPLVGGGLWTELKNLPAAGSKMLYAKHQNFGYISPLQLGIQCFNISSGQSVTDEIFVPVRAVMKQE